MESSVTFQEKSGKIVKEVTETTTLRVSHDTRFGVASYKLTSNTLREGHDHTDVRGILDAKGFGVKINDCQIGNDNSSRKGTNPKNWLLSRSAISPSVMKSVINFSL